MATDAPTSFKSAEIVPGVIDAPPADFLSITYGDRQLTFGQEFTPTQVKEAPNVTWNCNASRYYTLCITDPDTGINREVLHWLVTNVPGNILNLGDILTEYVGSGPPEGTGIHRYIFLLYEQPSKLNFDGEKRIGKFSKNGRMKFSIQKFADKYGLGKPVAGNMYRAQYDDYVPQLHAQFVD